jgi:hypothetical protein
MQMVEQEMFFAKHRREIYKNALARRFRVAEAKRSSGTQLGRRGMVKACGLGFRESQRKRKVFACFSKVFRIYVGLTGLILICLAI